MFDPHPQDQTTPRPAAGAAVASSRQVVMEHVRGELAKRGMRLDTFVGLANEGLLPDNDLRMLWQQHRDVLVPDWAA